MTTTFLSADPIAELWQTARAWCDRALAELGDPAAIAAAVAREAYAACRRRLALLEQFVMKLLLIEAARLPSHLVLPRRAEATSPAAMNAGAQCSAGAASCLRARESKDHADCTPSHNAPANARHAEEPANPPTWTVRFHVRLAWARRALATRRGRVAPLRLRGTPSRAASAPARAHALARRFEALRRMLADPRRAILALARKLAALGARACALAHRIA